MNAPIPQLTPAEIAASDARDRLDDARRVLDCLHGLLCHVSPHNPGLSCLNADDLAAVLRLVIDCFLKDEGVSQ